MNLIALILLLLNISFISSVSSFNFTCKFSKYITENDYYTTNGYDRNYYSYTIVKKPYECNVMELKVLEPIQFVSNITGKHSMNYSNSDVTSLRISSLVCHYIPIGLTIFFPDLEILRIEKSGLRSIQKYDLYEFGNLSYLLLNGNNLMTLDIGLFEFTHNLKHVNFLNNLIFHVDPMIFVDSENLKTVGLGLNTCTSGLDSYMNLPSERSTLHLNLLKNCLKTEYIQYLKDNRGSEINSIYNPSEIDRIRRHFQNETFNLSYSYPGDKSLF